MKWFYRQPTVSPKVVFECDAENIVDADKLFQEATGIDPDKGYDPRLEKNERIVTTVTRYREDWEIVQR